MSPRRRHKGGPPRPETAHAPKGRSPLVKIALAAAAVASLAFWAVAHGRREKPARTNVLLVTIDTLRADRLGCYGARAAATSILDGLATRGVRFAVAIAHTPLTAPSHASILTGLTPPRHGVRDNGTFVLPEAVPTVAEAFRAAGYRTGAFVSGFPLDRRFGLGRGFDVFDDRLPHGRDARRAPYVERTADATTRVALQWLRTAPAPWFLWVHYFDPHAPYEPPPEIAAQFEGRPYDGEIAFVDRALGELLRGAGDGGPGAHTLVLVTADHGEALGEHSEDTHGVFVYDATLRVPWIMAGSDVPAGRVSTVVARGVDVAPTLLDYAGLPPLAGSEGRSLRRAAAGAALPDAPAYAESLFARLHLGWAELHAWRTDRWKLVDAPRPELYALDSDAGETRDVAAAHGEVVASLRRPLRQILAVQPPQAAVAHTPEAAERLRALGYLGGSAPAKPTGRDPKDGIGLLHRLERGLAEARADPGLALTELTAVLREEPGLPLALRYRAIAHQVAGRYDAAVTDLRTLERQAPLSSEDLVLMAETLRLARRPEQALDALTLAAKQDPRAPDPLVIRARVLRSMGRNAEARTAYDEVLGRVPGQIEALRGLAELDLEAGALASAASRLEAVLETDPSDVTGLVRLGLVRVREGRLAEGRSLFERAVGLAPRDPEALLGLGGVLAKSGRASEAVPLLERAIQAGGPTTVALNSLGFARLESGDAAGALKALRQSLSLQSRQPQVAQVVAKLSAGRTP